MKQEQGYANGLGEVPICGSLDLLVGGQRDLVLGKTDEVVDLIVLDLDEACWLKVKELLRRWKARGAGAGAFVVGTSSLPEPEKHREGRCCSDARTDAAVRSHLVGSEKGRHRRRFGSRQKLEVKHLVAGSGNRQEVEIGPAPAPVLGPEHAFACPSAYASAPLYERPAIVHRLAAASEFDEIVGRGSGPNDVMVVVMATAVVTWRCGGRKTQREQGWVAERL